MKLSNLIRIICIAITVVFLNNSNLKAQQVTIPHNYSMVDSIRGDLNHDGIDELVVAYNIKKVNEDSFENVPRQLIIYKKSKQWTIWKKSSTALYGSREGGVLGDPYQEMQIKNGILSISQSGGSNWKWGHTDKYRFQNGEFYLIGYKSDFGMLCKEWTSIDFNLSTGKIVIKKEFEKCNTDGGDQKIHKTQNEIYYKKGLVINLQNRNAKEIKLVTPKYHFEVYLATEIN